MFKKNKRKKEHRYYKGKRKKKGGFWSKLSSKFLWVSIIFLTLLLLIYAFSFYRKLSQSEASQFATGGKEPKKPIFVRVQILDARLGSARSKGEDGVQKLSKRLEQISAGSIGKMDNITYETGETEKCDFASAGIEDTLAKQSLIIDRIGNENKDSPSDVALLTAKALGISPQNVIYRKLKDNYHDIALTLVIGDDYKILFQQPKKQ